MSLIGAKSRHCSAMTELIAAKVHRDVKLKFFQKSLPFEFELRPKSEKKVYYKQLKTKG